MGWEREMDRQLISKILEIVLLVLLIVGVAYPSYQLYISNQAVRNMLMGDPSKLLELYTKNTGNECMIIHP
jgi:hypothetical protein